MIIFLRPISMLHNTLLNTIHYFRINGGWWVHIYSLMTTTNLGGGRTLYKKTTHQSNQNEPYYMTVHQVREQMA